LPLSDGAPLGWLFEVSNHPPWVEQLDKGVVPSAILEQCGHDAVSHGVSEQTIYTWRKRSGTFQADDVQRLKQLDAENARLKKVAGSPIASGVCDGPGPVAAAGLPKIERHGPIEA
jgi:Transposase